MLMFNCLYKGKLIQAKNVLGLRAKGLRCPACSKAVFLRQSEYHLPHFSHKANEGCNYKGTATSSPSNATKPSKLELQEQFRKKMLIGLEKKLGETIADIFQNIDQSKLVKSVAEAMYQQFFKPIFFEDADDLKRQIISRIEQQQESVKNK